MTGGRLFGTDGIRGPFGDPPLVEAAVVGLGAALAAELGGAGTTPRVLLAGDTRDSTPALCGWLAAGLAAGGASTLYGGVLPTPAVSRLVASRGLDCGVAVSASHNLHPDNGIKLLDRRGGKWDEARERRLEARLAALPEPAPGTRPAAAELEPDPALAAEYLDLLAALLPGSRPLAGLRVLLDCAHGAASALAGPLFSRLGARAEVMAAAPDGRNINRGSGSTRPQVLARAVAAAGHELGFAFDGDADRALPADETGRVRDGDALLYLLAADLRGRGELVPPRIVATTMSNLGLEVALEALGVGLERCDVGDRAVVETLRRQGLRLGGEQSGHVVDLALAATGDGLLTAALTAAIVARSGQPLSRLLGPLPSFPQVLRNVPVTAKPDFDTLPAVRETARSVERRLGRRGRLVLRYSGTEPLARVMIEGESQAAVESLAEELAGSIEAAIGAR